MCLICIDLQKNKLAPIEALTNYREALETLDDDRASELMSLIVEKAFDFSGEEEVEGSFAESEEKETDWKYGSD